MVETFAELTVLAMAMFFAAFFCLKILVVPHSKNNSLKSIYEIKKTLQEER